MGVGCGATNVFELGCETEVRERSNETWLKIDYGQLHIRIKSMWLRRVYFVLLKFLRAKIVAPKRHTQKHCRWPHLSPRRRHACGMAGEPSSKLGRLSWRPLSFRKSSVGVRRAKAAISSGCKPHSATAPAGSNRSSHGGNEVAEAFD